MAAARAAQPSWSATPWQERLEIIRRAAELISERLMEYRPSWPSRSARTGSRPSARSRSPPTSSATTRRRWRTTTATTTRWATSATRRSTPGRPAAARRVRGHQPVQLPDGAGRRADRRGAHGRQHRRAQAARAASPMTAVKLIEAYASGRPGGRVQPGHGPGRDRRRRAPVTTRASTGSCSPARTRSAWGCSGRSRQA